MSPMERVKSGALSNSVANHFDKASPFHTAALVFLYKLSITLPKPELTQYSLDSPSSDTPSVLKCSLSIQCPVPGSLLGYGVASNLLRVCWPKSFLACFILLVLCHASARFLLSSSLNSSLDSSLSTRSPPAQNGSGPKKCSDFPTRELAISLSSIPGMVQSYSSS